MRVKCAICGKSADTTKGNYVYANGIHQHNKCPKVSTSTEQEKSELKELRDAIDKLCVEYDKPANWSLISSQIKKYLDMGYSYVDQLYTLKYVVEKDGTYWGYGRIEKFFSHAMEYRKRQEEYIKKKEESEKRESVVIKQIPSKPSFLEM